MSLPALVLLILIAAACGAIGRVIAGYSLGGFLVSAGVGFLGAVLGMWVASTLHLPVLLSLEVGGVDVPAVWSILGSAILVAAIGTLGGGRGR